MIEGKKNKTLEIAKEQMGKIFENFPSDKHDILLDLLNLDPKNTDDLEQILKQIRVLPIKQKIDIVRFLMFSVIGETDKTNITNPKVDEQILAIASKIGKFADKINDFQSDNIDDNELYDDGDNEYFNGDEDWDNEQNNYDKYKEMLDVKKCTLRITLKYTNIKVWRKIEVPSNITLRCLGNVIIDAMGWENSHFWQFRKRSVMYEPEYQIDEDMAMDLFDIRKAEDFCLSEILTKKGNRVTLEYDFGEGWEHEVRLLSVKDYTENEERKINFISGENACPPEDCGGVMGYEAICARFLEGPYKRRKSKSTYDYEEDYFSFYLKDMRFNPFFFSADETADYINDIYNDDEN